ncbi:hypothetical protein GCM10009808_20360 [Microbacterium sediminicola]|uniref:Uncharacterized protein n=1 Tax=Microbacterium sediminicola TaxID=415210 RepID=A0ABN2ICG4_9MICO
MTSVGETLSDASARDPRTPSRADRRRRKRSTRADLLLLGGIGILLVLALIAGGVTIVQTFYSASAFVERYLTLLADGRAAEALALPGVALDSEELEAAGLPSSASDALLRSAALGSLTDIHAISHTESDGVVTVTVSYTAGGHEATSQFQVERAGFLGIAPRWQFAQSPISVMELTVNGSTSFAVNGFEVDKRQVSADGSAADLSAPVSLLVFSPGLYSVTVDTATATSTGVAMLSDVAFTSVPVTVTAEATEDFVSLVQDQVDGFLDQCTTQQVLLPTACPFGYETNDRIVTLPEWSIIDYPEVTLVADGAGWDIPAATAMAHIEMDVRSIYSGAVSTLSQDVPFVVTGAITMQPDGSASISVASG